MTEPEPHEFDEDVNDGSMCVCGIPATVHDAWEIRAEAEVARLAVSRRGWIATAQEELERAETAEAQVAKVRALHTPFHVHTQNDGLNWDYSGCGTCHPPDDWEPTDGDWWPCPTLAALGSVGATEPDFPDGLHTRADEPRACPRPEAHHYQPEAKP